MHEQRRAECLSFSSHKREEPGSLISLLYKVTGRQQQKQSLLLGLLATGHFSLIIQRIPAAVDPTLIFLSHLFSLFLSVYFSPWHFYLSSSQFVESFLLLLTWFLDLNFHLYFSTAPMILDLFSVLVFERASLCRSILCIAAFSYLLFSFSVLPLFCLELVLLHTAPVDI